MMNPETEALCRRTDKEKQMIDRHDALQHEMDINKRFNDILQRDFSNEFIKKMQNAIILSHYKYGFASKTYPELAQARKCIDERLELYNKTHNTEYLIDIANFAMLEYMYPSYEDARYIPTDSSESPGLAGGISYKELMEAANNEF